MVRNGDESGEKSRNISHYISEKEEKSLERDRAPSLSLIKKCLFKLSTFCYYLSFFQSWGESFSERIEILCFN